MRPQDIQQLIAASLPGAEVDVAGDDGVHFACTVVYAGFGGLSPVKRHQLVYKALGDSFQGALHALSIQTHTPEEWQRQQPFAAR